ncbi:aminotransferase class IV [Fulvivirgaceae bacterium BMA12]|uniref:branched-chain-amino-acid transaminase n=1 Tax=Agaribacillus aureus TaxID=3051825 RepID=A0ABT8LA49_9BACT|nr:aminotransferase class IV [Fulvivirgaceae bacterium BMA12]
MRKFYFLNGEILPADETKLHISDLAILRGYGIFDFFRTNQGRPVFIEDHIARFNASASELKLNQAYSKQYISDYVEKLIALNGFSESAIKLVMTGGYSPNGYDLSTPNFAILVDEFLLPNQAYYKDGVKLITFQHVREFAKVKSINYLTAIMTAGKCKESGAIDALFHDGSVVSEVTRSNFFIIKNNIVITPDKGILKGITRAKTLQLARLHYKVEERAVNLKEIYAADEAFITSSTKRLMPVANIDGTVIGDGSPGRITQHLAELFLEVEKSYLAENC